MRAIVITEKGGPEVLAVQEVPDPVPGPAEVLVDVVTSAVNRADLMQRRGLYPGPPATYEIPGLEFAGRVAALGERVAGHAVGDPVMGIVGGAATPSASWCTTARPVAVPDALGLDAAGAFPRGVHHRLGRARPPGRADHRPVGAGPRRSLRGGHRVHTDRQGHRAPASRSPPPPASTTSAKRSEPTS